MHYLFLQGRGGIKPKLIWSTRFVKKGKGRGHPSRIFTYLNRKRGGEGKVFCPSARKKIKGGGTTCYLLGG